MSLEQIFPLIVMIVGWSLTAWLFWIALQMLKRSRIKHRRLIEYRRLAEEKKQAANESKP